MKQITHILFDLGGVLVELNGMPFFRAHYPSLTDEEIHRKWLSLSSVRQFERGGMPVSSFL